MSPSRRAASGGEHRWRLWDCLLAVPERSLRCGMRKPTAVAQSQSGCHCSSCSAIQREALVNEMNERNAQVRLHFCVAETLHAAGWATLAAAHAAMR